MSMPSPFLINSFSFFFLLLTKSSGTDLKCFWVFNCKKLPSVEPKLKSKLKCGLNYSLLSFKIY